jgi:hypothetical protein
MMVTLEIDSPPSIKTGREDSIKEVLSDTRRIIIFPFLNVKKVKPIPTTR